MQRDVLADDRPKILVTGPNKRLRFAWWATRFMLRKYDVDLTYAHPGRRVALSDYAGLIVGGGNDIEPEHYGLMEPVAKRHYDPERDAYELDLMERALQTNIPILGICRGSQLLNVIFGGSLLPDITGMRQLTSNRRTVRPVKQVSVCDESKLREILGVSSTRVNSLHEQAVDRVGSGLRPVASDRDHFIQAIEAPERPFTIGVQWHPEYLPYCRDQKKLMASFVSSVRRFNIERVPDVV